MAVEGPLSVDAEGQITTSLRVLEAADVERLLTVSSAADALERGFLARDAAELDGTARSVIGVEGGDLLLMPASGAEGTGVKVVSIAPGNRQRGLPLIQGVYVLFGHETLTPEILVDGAALTRLRTAAVSALATRWLARPDSRRLVVFGAGAQAAAHVEAMRAVLPIEHVTIVGGSPDSEHARQLTQRLRAANVEAEVGRRSAVREADVICACTTSETPVFDDLDLPAGAHVNAIGAYRLDMREVPVETLRRALLVVESLPATLAEAGDVVAAINAGALPSERFACTLAELLRGVKKRTAADQVTVFKSVGVPVEDLMIARALADAAQRGQAIR